MNARLDYLIEQVLGAEDAELARMYFGDSKLTEMALAAEAVAEDQLRKPFHLAVPPRDTEFAEVFEGKLKDILNKAFGCSLDPPKAV